MRINAITFFWVIVLSGCSTSGDKQHSYIHGVVDSLPIDKTENILIYTISPNDCLNCLIGFVSLNKELSATANAKVYIISVEREIEKDKFRQTMNDVDLSDTPDKVILWDKETFLAVNRSASVQKATGLSCLTIYNYQKDSIVYNKPIREIMGTDEIKTLLGKIN